MSPGGQETLFDFAHRDHVSSRIARSILDFLASRATFHGGDLLAYVERDVGQVAPGSPERILRLLRRRGLVN